MPIILIRTEISQEYGFGHAVRMRAVALALAHHGASVRFLTTTPALEAFVAPMVCDTIAPSTHEDTFECIQRCSPDVLVCDTKTPFDESLYPVLRKDMRVVRIDHPDATPDSCDLLVAPVNHWHPETVARLQHAFGPRFLYGWDYVMLAPEVASMHPLPYLERWPPRIVVCAGGSDPTGTLPHLWGWMYTNHDMPERLFLVPQHASYQLPGGYSADVIQRSEGHGWPKRTGQWSAPFDQQYLRTASLVLTMFGVTCYECLWYQTPMVVFAHTQENGIGAAGLETVARGLVWHGGRLDDWTPRQFCEAVSRVYSMRQQYPPQTHACMDGHGIERVATAILELA